MTMFERIKKAALDDNVEEMGRLLCRFYYNNIDARVADDIDICDQCPFFHLCSRGSNGFVNALQKPTDKHNVIKI